jgi:YggT family protein
VCNPYLRLFRRVLPPLGPLDLSPVLAVVVLFALQRGLDALFARLH